MKKIIYKMLCLIIILSLVGCGNAVSTMNEEESDINSVSNNEIVEDSGLDMDDEDLAEAISDLPVDMVEELSDETVETSTSSENTVSDQSPSPEPEPHVHQYVETVTVQPTCAVAGEKVLTCECGDTKIESVPATGVHNWDAQATIVHHDEIGHVEQTQVQVGWTEARTEYECPLCGYRADTPAGISDHQLEITTANGFSGFPVARLDEDGNIIMPDYIPDDRCHIGNTWA